MDSQRNFLIAAMLSLAIIFLWQEFIINFRQDHDTKIEKSETIDKDELNTIEKYDDLLSKNSAALTISTSSKNQNETLETRRVVFKSEKLEGTINLRGARIDDLHLSDYRETIDSDSPTIRLLKPFSDREAYFAEFGWSSETVYGALPGPSTNWTQISKGHLTPENPLILEYANEKSLTFRRMIELDNRYMFSVTDTVLNDGPSPASLKSYGRIARYGEPKVSGIYVLHEGMIGLIGDQNLDEIDYEDIQDDRRITKDSANAGWLGITDKYWAAVLVPGQAFVGRYNYYKNNRPFYQTDFISDWIMVPSGGALTISNKLFAGAKKVDIIDRYEVNENIDGLSYLIDWGSFYFLTKPLFYIIDYFFKLFGNFGVAILIVTVLLKILFFPLANKSYVSMANMKKMQPEMTSIRKRFSGDMVSLQKAMMELYKKEKINPAAGCWPVLIQIPVFFALYKVIYITLEMRHAPFFGWIRDLSAPDPTSLFNLFGLLHYDLPLFLMIGVWPLLMGMTLFIQMQMNPMPPDRTQQMIFKWMPVVFTFMLATFPSGLVIYWAWNNFLSIIQQGTIMKRQGTKIELWDNLKGLMRKKTDSY
ncbi:membrane protein insertase YidC [Candidatus Endowatersipora endosymbiont of Watersipora subatra]|uniref:membrane protein insertase YidC n=1 Tax=Candidatus Endowatersipora endosymbiont of Watersipora subatra TaxID=3077946 RepID=UPI00312CA1F3